MPVRVQNDNIQRIAVGLIPGGGLKPQMDNIFAEVAKSLPSINFDLSDMSDSEEPVIFHRSLKTAQIDYDDDKDLDTSLSGDSASDLFKGPLGTIHIPSVDKNNPVAHAHSSPMTFDNDLAALLAAQEEGEYGEDQVSSWKDLEKIAQRDKQRRKEKDEAKAAEKKRSSLKEEKERRRLQGIERQRAREKELALMYMSAKAPHLSMQILDAIDLESESLTIIQKLAKFSMTQAGQECDLSAIDPQTGASISIEASSTFRPIGQDAASASSQTSVVKATKVEPFRPTVIGAGLEDKAVKACCH
nr:hypothetical protein BaRGS_014347 [Batillaria attramentaria]